MSRNPEAKSFSCVVGSDVKLTSDIVMDGDLKIEGEIQGTVRCATLVIAEGGRVTGSVHCEDARIEGQISGALYCSRGQLGPASRIDGYLRCRDWSALTVEPGAQLGGSVNASTQLDQRSFALLRKIARKSRPRISVDEKPLAILLDNGLVIECEGMLFASIFGLIQVERHSLTYSMISRCAEQCSRVLQSFRKAKQDDPTSFHEDDAALEAELFDVASPSYFGPEMAVTSDVVTKGDLHVEGQLCGTIHCAALRIGMDATVAGNIRADMATVHGLVDGPIHSDVVRLKKGGHFNGPVLTRSLEVDEGATFECASRRKGRLFHFIPARKRAAHGAMPASAAQGHAPSAPLQRAA